MKLIETKTLGAAAASIEFTSIPQTFTDLLLVVSRRSNLADEANEDLSLTFNSSTSGYSWRVLYGNGTSGLSFNSASNTRIWAGGGGSNQMTANTFASSQIYVPNYTLAAHKSVSCESVSETNATFAFATLTAGLWADTAAITSLSISGNPTSSFLANTTASLYGILKGSDGIVTTS